MGEMFGGSKSKSTLSKSQQGLHPALAAFFQERLASPPGGVGELNSILSGDSRFLNSITDNLLNKAFLPAAMRGFERVTKPGIMSDFARVGGVLSSRRTSTLANARTQVQEIAQGQVAAQLPALLGLQMSGINQRENLRYMPAQQALSFAMPGTVTQGAGSTVGSDLLGALAMVAGAYFAPATGGASLAGASAINAGLRAQQGS